MFVAAQTWRKSHPGYITITLSCKLTFFIASTQLKNNLKVYFFSTLRGKGRQVVRRGSNLIGGCIAGLVEIRYKIINFRDVRQESIIFLYCCYIIAFLYILCYNEASDKSRHLVFPLRAYFLSKKGE